VALRLTRGVLAAGSAVALLTGILAGPASAAPKPGPTHPESDYMGSSIPASERAQSTRAGARALTAAAAPAGVPGLDVSHWQGAVDWSTVAANGAKFGYMKATEGVTFLDSQFATNYAGSAAAGILRGAYHFGLPDTSTGAAQADYFMAHGGGWVNDGKTMPPVLDIEYNPYSTSDWAGWCYNRTPAQITAWITDFVNRVHDRTNQWPVVYTTSGWWNNCTGSNTAANASTPLWIAPVASDGGNTPAMPAGWTSYTFYQWATSGTFPGDQDVFAGTATELSGFAAGASPDKIQAKYTALGGASSYLGAASGAEYQIAGGWAQNYANGVIYYTAAAGAWAVSGSILARYQALGGPSSVLGFPITDETGTPDGVGRFNHFEGGSIYYTSATGAHAIYGLIKQKWAALGWERSPLGYPTTDETGTPDGIGRYNHFSGANGSIYYTSATGAHAIYGMIKQKWAALGWEQGPLGYPATDETGTPDGIARYNHFSGSNGSIYYTSATGAHAVYGMIKQKWASLGWERSYLKYPTSDEFDISGGRENTFQGGYITWTPASGAVDHHN